MLASSVRRSLLRRLVVAPRLVKKAIIWTGDVLAFYCALNLAMMLRLGEVSVSVNSYAQLMIYSLTLIALQFAGLYRSILRAFNDRLMKPVFFCLGVLVVALTLLIKVDVLPHIPKTVPFVYAFLIFSWIWLSRIVAKHILSDRMSSLKKERVLIYGAGNAGQQILSSLRDNSESHIVGFIDDDESLVNGYVEGVCVFSGQNIAEVIAKYKISLVLLAIPTTTRHQRQQILNRLELMHVKVKSLPSMNQLMDEKISISDVKEVDIADLLGRDPVPPIKDLLAKNIYNKVVMVTGAGGSIGSELCRQILKSKPKHLILFELCEYSLYAIEQELKKITTVPMSAFLGSVLKQSRLENIMQGHGVQTVYHAAAYKHVPLVEVNPFEGVMNNTVGTARCAAAAITTKVETFVLISTDKAVRPTNVMGASKRLAELACQGLAQLETHQTQFSMVRFGNVLGSSGSVVPLFRQQILQGGPLTVTDAEMTRYFMTIPEAAQLVIQAGAMGIGGDVFLLDMGQPVRIRELARQMILLSGLTIQDEANPSGDIEIQYTGLRLGEKLYEELLIDATGASKTEHQLIMRSVEKSYPNQEMQILLTGLVNASKKHDLLWLLDRLEQYVEGYKRSSTFT